MKEKVNHEIEVIDNDFQPDEADFQSRKHPSYTQQIVYDENGDVISNKFWKGSTNGRGWVMMYTEKVQDLVIKCPSASTLKVFMLLAMGQQFEERGYISTKKAIQEKLGIDKSTCLAAFKWLKENFVIVESRIEGCSEFMVNPEYVTVGRDKKKRIKEWVKRWNNQTVTTIPMVKVAHSLPPKKKTLKGGGRSMSID